MLINRALCSGLLEVIEVYGQWNKVPEGKGLRFESGHKRN